MGFGRRLKTGYQARIPAAASTSDEREAIGIYPSKADALRALRRAEAAWEARETIPTRRSPSGLREVARRRSVPKLTEACHAHIAEAQTKSWIFTRSADTNRSLNHRHREPFLPSSLESFAAITHVVDAYPPQGNGGAPYSMTAFEFAALVRTLLFGGLRPEEVLSLTVASVRPAGVWVGEVLVTDRVSKGWVLEPPKSGGRGHLVALPPVKPWGRVRAAAGLGPDDARAEWPGGMQLRDLRAVCAGMLAAAGVTMPEARAHLGHTSDGVTTTRHYMRPLDVPEIRVIATRVEGGIVERLTAVEKVIDQAAERARFAVIGQEKGMTPPPLIA